MICHFIDSIYIVTNVRSSFRVFVISCFCNFITLFVTLQNFITEIAPDHSTTLSSFATPEGLDSACAAGTF